MSTIKYKCVKQCKSNFKIGYTIVFVNGTHFEQVVETNFGNGANI